MVNPNSSTTTSQIHTPEGGGVAAVLPDLDATTNENQSGSRDGMDDRYPAFFTKEDEEAFFSIQPIELPKLLPFAATDKVLGEDSPAPGQDTQSAELFGSPPEGLGGTSSPSTSSLVHRTRILSRR